jgi:hypothetical protein
VYVCGPPEFSRQVLAAAREAGVPPARCHHTDVPNQYGHVQVQVVMRAGKIADVRAVRLPYGDGKSREINRAAAPQLKQQALRAQSAAVDGVSGATYTSDGHRQSLQAALDRAAASPSIPAQPA